jgi:drug/metabolite transporter (DMT)-like permease
MPYRVTWIDWLHFAGLVVSWGSSFAMSKVALQYFTPEWVASARLIIGATVLFAASLFQTHTMPRGGKFLGLLAFFGLIGNAAPFFAITWGMQFISSGVAGLLMGTIPLIIVVMAHFALPGEQLTRSRALGFALGFLGIIVLMGPENLLQLSANGKELLGELAVISGCLMYGVQSIMAKRANLPGTVPVSAVILAFGALFATANAALHSPLPAGPYPLSPTLALFGLGLIPTGLATVLLFKAMQRTSPTFTSMSNYLVPVYALVFGALTLGESIGTHVLLALAFIMSGVFVSRLKT